MHRAKADRTILAGLRVFYAAMLLSVNGFALQSNIEEFNKRFIYPSAYFDKAIDGKALKKNYSEYKPSLEISEKPSSVFRVLGYNVHHFSDIWTDYPSSENNVLEKIAQAIKNIDADIVGLQEVLWDEEQATKFKKILDIPESHYFFCEASNWPKRPFGNLLISRFPIIEAQCLKLPNKDEYEGRSAIISTVLTPHGNSQVVVTHLDAQDDSGRLRKAQLEYLVDKMTPKMTTFLLGDMNTILPSSLSERMLERIKQIDKERNAESIYDELLVISNF